MFFFFLGESNRAFKAFGRQSTSQSNSDVEIVDSQSDNNQQIATTSRDMQHKHGTVVVDSSDASQVRPDKICV